MESSLKYLYLDACVEEAEVGLRGKIEIEIKSSVFRSLCGCMWAKHGDLIFAIDKAWRGTLKSRYSLHGLQLLVQKVASLPRTCLVAVSAVKSLCSGNWIQHWMSFDSHGSHHSQDGIFMWTPRLGRKVELDPRPCGKTDLHQPWKSTICIIQETGCQAGLNDAVPIAETCALSLHRSWQFWQLPVCTGKKSEC